MGRTPNVKKIATACNASVIPSVTYTDPEMVWVGLTEDQEKAQGAYFSPSWTAFQAECRRDFSVNVDGISN